MPMLQLSGQVFWIIFVKIHVGFIVQQLLQQKTGLNQSFFSLLTAKDWF